MRHEIAGNQTKVVRGIRRKILKKHTKNEETLRAYFSPMTLQLCLNHVISLEVQLARGTVLVPDAQHKDLIFHTFQNDDHSNLVTICQHSKMSCNY